MGWIISIILFIAHTYGEVSDVYLIASGLFAIAGSIAFKSINISITHKENN